MDFESDKTSSSARKRSLARLKLRAEELRKSPYDLCISDCSPVTMEPIQKLRQRQSKFTPVLMSSLPRSSSLQQLQLQQPKQPTKPLSTSIANQKESASVVNMKTPDKELKDDGEEPKNSHQLPSADENDKIDNDGEPPEDHVRSISRSVFNESQSRIWFSEMSSEEKRSWVKEITDKIQKKDHGLLRTPHF